MANKKNPADEIRCEKTTTEINTWWVGPIPIHGDYAQGNFHVPLATLELPLIHGTNRGAKVTQMPGVDGIQVQIMRDWMTRAPVLETKDAHHAKELSDFVQENMDMLKEKGDATSHYGKIVNLHGLAVDNLYYLRVEMDCKDAAGHTMSERAAAAIVQYLTKTYPDTKLLSLSGNFCEDKKPGMVNTILGRGKSVNAWIDIPQEAFDKAETGDPLYRYIKGVKPHQLVYLNTIKNHIGSLIAGNAMGGNGHHANVYAALAAATGQDLANTVEGSQGIDHITYDGKNLHFAIYAPSLIVGTKGGPETYPQNIPTQIANRKRLGCDGSGTPYGANAKKLAEIFAATILCAEFNLMSVLANNYELINSHLRLERGNTQ